MIELGNRAQRLPAPPHIVWADLAAPRVTGTRAWLDLADDETVPRVLEAAEPRLVVWSSLWPDRPRDVVRLEVGAVGAETLLRFVHLSPDDAPDASRLGHLRLRINRLLFANLRHSYGQ